MHNLHAPKDKILVGLCVGWDTVYSVDSRVWGVWEDVYSRERAGGWGNYQDETCGLGGFD